MDKHTKKPARNPSGQALLEFLFVVVFVVLTFATMINNLRTDDPNIGLCPLWASLVKSVSAGCATCRGPSHASDGANQKVCDPN